MFSSYQCLRKGVQDFLFQLDLELFEKIKKQPGFYTLTETRFLTFLTISQDLNKIKTFRTPFCRKHAQYLSKKY